MNRNYESSNVFVNFSSITKRSGKNNSRSCSIDFREFYFQMTTMRRVCDQFFHIGAGGKEAVLNVVKIPPKESGNVFVLPRMHFKIFNVVRICIFEKLSQLCELWFDYVPKKFEYMLVFLRPTPPFRHIFFFLSYTRSTRDERTTMWYFEKV